MLTIFILPHLQIGLGFLVVKIAQHKLSGLQCDLMLPLEDMFVTGSNFIRWAEY